MIGAGGVLVMDSAMRPVVVGRAHGNTPIR